MIKKIDTPEPFSPPQIHNTASPISSFGSYPSSFGNTGSKAQGSMKLGHKPKAAGSSTKKKDVILCSIVTRIFF